MHVKTKPRASACDRLTLSLAKLTTPSTSTPSISNINRVLTISSGVALQHGRGHHTTTAHCIASRSCAVAADMLPTAVSTTGRCTGMIYACILAFNASVMLLKSTGIHTLPVRCRCPSYTGAPGLPRTPLALARPVALKCCTKAAHRTANRDASRSLRPPAAGSGSSAGSDGGSAPARDADAWPWKSPDYRALQRHAAATGTLLVIGNCCCGLMPSLLLLIDLSADIS